MNEEMCLDYFYRMKCFEMYVDRIVSAMENEEFFKLDFIENDAEDDFTKHVLTYKQLCMLRKLIGYCHMA